MIEISGLLQSSTAWPCQDGSRQHGFATTLLVLDLLISFFLHILQNFADVVSFLRQSIHKSNSAFCMTLPIGFHIVQHARIPWHSISVFKMASTCKGLSVMDGCPGNMSGIPIAVLVIRIGSGGTAFSATHNNRSSHPDLCWRNADAYLCPF